MNPLNPLPVGQELLLGWYQDLVTARMLDQHLSSVSNTTSFNGGELVPLVCPEPLDPAVDRYYPHGVSVANALARGVSPANLMAGYLDRARWNPPPNEDRLVEQVLQAGAPGEGVTLVSLPDGPVVRTLKERGNDRPLVMVVSSDGQADRHPDAIQVDGSDVIDLVEGIREAVDIAREEGHLVTVVALVAQIDGRRGPDGAEELGRWRQKDPVRNLRQLMIEERILSEDQEGEITRRAEEATLIASASSRRAATAIEPAAWATPAVPTEGAPTPAAEAAEEEAVPADAAHVPADRAAAPPAFEPAARAEPRHPASLGEPASATTEAEPVAAQAEETRPPEVLAPTSAAVEPALPVGPDTDPGAESTPPEPSPVADLPSVATPPEISPPTEPAEPEVEAPAVQPEAPPLSMGPPISMADREMQERTGWADFEENLEQTAGPRPPVKELSPPPPTMPPTGPSEEPSEGEAIPTPSISMGEPVPAGGAPADEPEPTPIRLDGPADEAPAYEAPADEAPVSPSPGTVSLQEGSELTLVFIGIEPAGIDIPGAHILAVHRQHPVDFEPIKASIEHTSKPLLVTTPATRSLGERMASHIAETMEEWLDADVEHLSVSDPIGESPRIVKAARELAEY